MKYFIATYGCQANIADSERIETRLKNRGYKKTLDEKEANILVVNACSVRQSAMDRVYGKINKFSKKGGKIILTGCVLEADKKKLKNKVSEIWNPEEYFDEVPVHNNGITAQIPIMSGCDNFCTYCAVPFTRGREKSRPDKEIISEVRGLVQKRHKEIWLLGQAVNKYKFRKTDFPKLLRKLDKIPGKFWLRFTSPHPHDFSDELIKTLASLKHFPRYINLPLQSGDNEILKKMNRNYTAEEYFLLDSKIKKTMPDIAISTDAIVGFPGETRKQFKNTLDLFKRLKFDMAFLSEYSSRSGTAAAMTMKDDISKKEKGRRKNELNKILIKTASLNNKKFLGKTIEVLTEKTKDGRIFGRSEGNKVVEIKNTAGAKIGEFAKVKIAKTGPWKLEGEIAKPKIICVIGPTASGKSSLAVELACKFNGEVISADSRQIYIGMDIGSGKITKKEMKGIPHHLLDVCVPKKEFNASDFKRLAEKTIKEIVSRGKIPIICGGTGFYIQTLLGPEIPEIVPDKNLRKKLEKKSVAELFEILKKLDPERAEKVDKNNPRRLVRAIEIAEKLGKVPALETNSKKYDILWLGIKKDKKQLEKAVCDRVDAMIKKGLEKEVEKLVKKYGWTKILKNTIGYKEWLDKNPIEKIKTHTLQYAKRQITWFKKFAPETKWLALSEVEGNKNRNEAIKLVEGFL
ncbi:MAG: tRNA (adenosine(37)-N6)-dimethylallyltransferase MiaA [Candidatus Pacebacteria bacterium]|nr:tRNA (adenosine(37)-N6)-dimethylallyltransferase MiaA [Candidatus Paceibacterota bacterium]